MKEKIKQFVLSKGWLLVGTAVTVFILSTFAFWVAFGITFAAFVVQAFLYTKWS